VEAFLAHRIEKNFSKGEILEMYLNRIYFGSGFYGINAASKGYFGKEVSEITLEEAATLCGLIKSPNGLSPFNNPDKSKQARDYVFERMVAENMLTRKEADELKATPIKTVGRRKERKRSFEYAYEQIRQQVVEQIGFESASQGGFEIYTTIDSDLQQVVQQSLVNNMMKVEQNAQYEGQTHAEFDKILTEWRKKEADMEEDENKAPNRPKPEYVQGSALVIDTKTGAIRALVGGRDFTHSAFDRTMLARRKPGTAFTPFVYASGFARRQYPGTLVEDSPLDNRFVQIGGMTGILGEWGVEQIPVPDYENWITARQALIKGKNAATVRFGIQVGVDNVVEFAKDAGMTFKGEIQKYNSTFLGNSEVSMKELTLGYTVFANQGSRPQEAFIIDEIRRPDGTKIFENRSNGSVIDVLDPYSAYQVHSALEEALKSGTGKLAYDEYGLEDFPAAGKTGTAHFDFKDTWFVGYTDQVTCAVWAGFDRARPIYPGAFSNQVTLPIWTEIMNEANKIFPASKVKAPREASRVEICSISGERATPFCFHHHHDEDGSEEKIRDSYIEYLNPNYKLTRACAVHSAGGRMNLALLNPPTIGGDSNDSWMRDGAIRPRRIDGYGLNVTPIFMQSPTVIGDDPYNAPQGAIRPRIIAPPPPPEGEEEGTEEVAEGDMPAEGDPEQTVAMGPDQEGEENGELAPIFRSSNTTPRPATMGPIAPPPPPQPPAISQPRIPTYPGESQPEGSRRSESQPGTPNAPREELAPVFRNRSAVLPEVQEPGPPPATEDGLPSILEEVPRAIRIEPPRAERIEFD
ncbi:MAG: transglycosylase domain-containing protein, partial [Verrucomicrobiota bacterium]